MNIVSKLLTLSLAILCCSTMFPKQSLFAAAIGNNPDFTYVVKNPQSEPGGM